ncbi:MAG: hypothetical protein K0Q79_3467 [Flavipsychrobacter sp.]|nr:hypothetical protein [Flavipsychrobacter sp.]
MASKISLIALLILIPWVAPGYSILTHEAIIDATWDKTIRPLLLQKYPGATDAQLTEAHAYAYGGSLVPDMGYYPYGNKFFTDLIHYVRTGDFVTALLEEARDINEYAFAIGVLSHYYSDKYGHSIATNHCVPLTYPKDKEKFGPVVTYEQSPIAHVRVEFGFDILQTARGNYASDNYRRFVGFKIAQPVLERAFLKTYGLSINDLFKDFSRAEGSFRWAVNDFYPLITRTAWMTKKRQIKKTTPTITRRKFEYKMQHARYHREYGKNHERPGIMAAVLAKVIWVLPKVGPLKYLKIKVPGTEAEKLFIKSFDTIQANFEVAVRKLGTGHPAFQNIDYDTGKETMPEEYHLADKTYGALLVKLGDQHFRTITPPLKQNIIQFYNGCNENMAATAGSDDWKKISTAIDQLNSTPK